ncbi:MAG: hypothetical protein KDD36_02885 [Flavobacteriales bacterium]|nr:hypothetical protein [Flavobacteriales bacterium]
MNERLSRFISYLFHPISLPLLSAFVLLNTRTYVAFSLTTAGKAVIYFTLFTFTALMPLIISLSLLRNGMITSLHMPTREERRVPMLATALSYMAAYYVLSKFALPRLVVLLHLGASLAVIGVLLINLRWKISIHMVGIGGFIGAILAIAFQLGTDLRLLLAAALVVAGIVATARLSLKMHEPAQVYAGFALGLCCEWLTISAL